MNTEIEILLLIPKAVVDNSLILSDLDMEEIEQGYFTPDKIQTLLIPLLSSESKSHFISTENGRIRKKGKKYYITLKNKMSETLTRDELEEEISETDYQKLLPEINAGHLKKNRYYLPFYEYVLEIDLITELNNQKFKPEFLTIDLELEGIEHFKKARELIQKNSWLKYTHEISGSELSKYLGMRKLCKFGFTNELKNMIHKIIKEILKHYQS